MPLYEYQCDACGREFELIRKFSDPPLEKCPHCGGTVRKLFSSPAIQFKGSGFYITDYAKKDQTAPPSDDSKSEPASKDTSGKSGEKSGEKSSDKSEKSEKAEKTARTEKAERAEKSERAEKAGKSDKSEKAGKADKATTKSEAASAAKAPSKD
jgi:putative FmdB family regulatory protein